MASAAPSASGSITLLEWNPHWKTSKDFGEHVTSDIKNWLTEYHVDFATIIEFTNLGDTTTVGEKTARPSRFRAAGGGRTSPGYLKARLLNP